MGLETEHTPTLKGVEKEQQTKSSFCRGRKKRHHRSPDAKESGKEKREEKGGEGKGGRTKKRREQQMTERKRMVNEKEKGTAPMTREHFGTHNQTDRHVARPAAC